MALISICTVDPLRLEPFHEAMETFGIEIEKGLNLEQDEWAITCISPLAIAYLCGAIARRGATIEHSHQPAELELYFFMSFACRSSHERPSPCARERGGAQRRGEG